MTDFDEIINKLRQRDRERKKAEQEARERPKREAWESIQAHHPDMADFLTKIKATFGKPKCVVIQTPEIGKVRF